MSLTIGNWLWQSKQIGISSYFGWDHKKQFFKFFFGQEIFSDNVILRRTNISAPFLRITTEEIFKYHQHHYQQIIIVLVSVAGECNSKVMFKNLYCSVSISKMRVLYYGDQILQAYFRMEHTYEIKIISELITEVCCIIYSFPRICYSLPIIECVRAQMSSNHQS